MKVREIFNSKLAAIIKEAFTGLIFLAGLWVCAAALVWWLVTRLR